MHQHAIWADIVDVLGVDFEVEHRDREAGARGHPGDLQSGLVGGLEPLTRLQVAGRNERLAIFAPERVIAGGADRRDAACRNTLVISRRPVRFTRRHSPDGSRRAATNGCSGAAQAAR